MERRGLFLCLTLMALALSCTKEAGLPPVGSGDGTAGMVELTFWANTGQTKASDTSFEDKIASLQVFLFNEDGRLESVGYSDSDTVSLRCYAGDKSVYAVANHDEIKWTTGTTVSDLMNIIVRLDDENWNVMVGVCDISEDMIFTDEPNLIIMDLVRVAARIKIHLVFNKSLTRSSLTIHNIFITNVVGDAKLCAATSEDYSYEPELWYNRCGNEGDLESLLYNGDIDLTLHYDYTALMDRCFYCYPNPTKVDDKSFFAPSDEGDLVGLGEWTPRYTRLVLETTYDGESSYYTITIGGVQSNHSYDVTLYITGYGSETAEGQLEFGGVYEPTEVPSSLESPSAGDGLMRVIPFYGGHAQVMENVL